MRTPVVTRYFNTGRQFERNRRGRLEPPDQCRDVGPVGLPLRMKAINISLTAACEPEQHTRQDRAVQARSQLPDCPLRQRTAQRRKTTGTRSPESSM